MNLPFKLKQQWLKVLVFSLCCLVLSVGVACGSNSVLTSNAPIPPSDSVLAGSVLLQCESNPTSAAIKFVESPVSEGTFLAVLDDATKRLESTPKGCTSQTTSAAVTSTQFIYQADPTSVTFEDFVLVLATSTLPPSLRTAENIATQANTLFASGNFSAANLSPVPDAINTNYVAGGSTPAPDLTDAALVYAATFLPPDLRTRDNLAATVNAILPGANVSPEDILAIPGVDLPGGITVVPAVTTRPAGSIQISVQINNLETSTFQVGAAQFFQIPTLLFPGFTSYAAEPGSSLIQVAFGQLLIPGVPPDTCVVVHVPGQDPRIEDTQIAASATCDATVLSQVDRMGLPGIATVFIPPNPLEPGPPLEDAFNLAIPANDQRDFREEVVNSLTVLFSLNDAEPGEDPSDDAAAIQGLADVLLPDILPFDLDAPSGFASLNGRNLDDDVIDVELALISEGFCTSDLVGNDSVFRDEFPFFGVPN